MAVAPASVADHRPGAGVSMFEEIRPKHGRDGREARTALPVSPRLKAGFAAVGVIACGALSVVAWWLNGPVWVPWLLVALAIWALADTGWQWRRHVRTKRTTSTGKGE
ncbi:MAG: hypothetical protein ACRD0P_13250 [Stackebrandtia sp.]